MQAYLNQTLIPVSTLSPAGLTSGAIPMTNFSRMGIQVIWSGLQAVDAVAASGVLTIGAGEVTITAVEAGTAGNSILVSLTGEGIAGSETVLVVGNAIGVAIENGETTAAQLVAALEASPEAMALISVSVTTAGAMATPDSVTLSGGTAGTVAATVRFEVSNNGTDWDLVMTDLPVAVAAGNLTIGVEDIVFTYSRLSVASTTTVGTVAALASFRI